MTDSIGVFAGIALKATVVLGLAALSAAILRRQSAAVRHLIWLAALGALVVLPSASTILPAWRPSLPASVEGVFSVDRIVVDVVGVGKEGQISFSGWLSILWSAGALVVFSWSLGAHVRAALLSRRAVLLPASAAVPVRLSAAVPVPMVCGIWKQTILLPEEASRWTSERLRVVLAHESAHAIRHDTLAQVLAQLACALYWPHPLVWWASGQLRKESEQAADDGVLVQGEKASVYARHLIDIVRGLARPIRAPQGGIPMAGASELESRLKAMFSPNRDRRKAGWKPAVTAVVMALCLLVPLAALRAPAQNAGGSLGGVVKDSSGAVVPHAAVTLLELGSDRREFAITNNAGEFHFAPLPEGVYALQVASPGFARLEQRGIEVSATQSTTVSLVLNVGKVQETLTVSAEGSRPVGIPGGSGTPARIRVGGSVQATKLEYKVSPQYPAECKAEGVEGTVLLRGLIGQDGSLINLEPINKLVDQRLVNAAMDAVRQWCYRPTLLNGEPVEVVTEIQINFILAR
jgi:TonB family protein